MRYSSFILIIAVMKKSTFDFAPALVEFEGGVVRINFDVESVMQEFPSMGDGETEQREVFLANVVRVPHPLTVETISEQLVKEGFDEYKAAEVANEVILNLVQQGLATGDELALAKAMVIAKIEQYDKSDAVNEFTLNGNPMWIPRELRNELLDRVNREIERGHSILPVDYNGTPIPLPCAEGKPMIEQLKYYADDCYTKTAEHKIAVNALSTVEQVLAYDYTVGYPEKLSFTISIAE